MGLSTGELRDKFFWRAVFAELFATAVFIYLVSSLLTTLSIQSIVEISLGIGLAISVLVQIFGPISGAHINPAVTIGLFVNNDITLIRTVFYTLAQLAGAAIGAAITYGLTPERKRGLIGVVMLQNGVTLTQGLFVELLLTMLLVLTVLASTSTDNGRKDFGYANALAIGISIVVAHIVGIPYTGASINPARAFGPSVVFNSWPEHHWIYWLGPYLGGIIAGLLYRFIFGIQEPRTTVTISTKSLEQQSLTSLRVYNER